MSGKAKQTVVFVYIRSDRQPLTLLPLLLSSLVSPNLPLQWSYPLHCHVRDVDTHVSSAGPGQKMSCKDRL